MNSAKHARPFCMLYVCMCVCVYVCVCVLKLSVAASASVCQRQVLLSAALPLPQSLPVIRICFSARLKRRLRMQERERGGELWGSGDRCMLH